MSPPRFAINQVVLVNLAFLVIMLSGIMVARKIPVDVFPDISFNSALLITIWPGASADEVERMVTRKIEEEVRDVTGIKEWYSFSSQGVSEINIEWEETLSEIEQQSAVNDLRAAIDRVTELPVDAERTILRELSVSEVNDSCMIAVTDVGGVGEFSLREVARSLERKVERLEGVRKGRLMGARERELRVYVDKERALQFDLTLAEISALIARNNQNMPGGTYSNDKAQEITVRGLGNFVSPEELAATVVRKSPDGNHVALGEIAEVRSDFERRWMYGYYNGYPTITVGVGKTKGADVSEVVERVREMLAGEIASLPPGIGAEVVWDSSVFVKKRLGILRDNLALGIAFVVLILWLTVGFRNSLLAIIGVPFSFLTALLLFPLLGLTINLLSLIGFVLVSGMLVDDAIIVIENIYRHIEEGEDIVEATINGTEEVMWPVIAAICTTMAAFIPMLLVTGTSGQFMSILPKAVIACLIASLIECLFVLPAHYIDWGSTRGAASALESYEAGARGIARWSHGLRAQADLFIDRIRNAYLRALEHVLANRTPFLISCVAAFYFACGVSSHVRVDLFPSDFNQLFVTIQSPVDYSLDQTNEVVLALEAALEPIADELLEVSTYTGQGMAADERPIFGSNYGLLFISFQDTEANVADPGRMVRRIREIVEAHRVAQPTGLDNLIVVPPRNGPPIGKPVAVRVVSEDYDLAKKIASDIKLELATMPGVYNIEDNVPLGRRELRIGLDEYRASLHGLTFEDLGIALRAANDGLVPSSFKDPYSDEDIDIRVLLREDQRTSASQLVDVELRTPENQLVKIGDVGTIGLTRGYQRLYHFDAQRAVVVYADVDGRQATSVTANQALEARFSDVSLQYPGVSLVFGGEYQATNRAFEDMGRAFIIALIAIYAILAAQFRSYLQPLIVMCVIVFAYIGVVLGMYIWDYALSMYVIYAVVGLAGVVVNDSLVLIDFINKERERGAPALEAARMAGRRRFRAVMLTTLTTVAGLLPMAMGLSGVSMVFGPFAAAIVAGLSVASGLTLFVVPSLYLTVEAGKERLFEALGRGPAGPVALDTPSPTP
jgi:HAE1 family hydrophobic/amphiphilic exporter-1